MFSLFISIILVVVLDLVITALVANGLGIKVREICLGFGPQLIKAKRLTLKLIPMSGFVRFTSSEDDDYESINRSGMFDQKPKVIQASVLLSGLGCLGLMAYALNGQVIVQIYLDTYTQIIQGGLSPVSAAQLYIKQSVSYTETHSFIDVFSMVVIKSIAINLMPIGVSKGASVIALLADFSDKVTIKIKLIGVIITFLFYISWLSALVIYLL